MVFTIGSVVASFASEKFDRLQTVRQTSRPAQLDFLSRPSSSAHVWGPSLNLFNQTDVHAIRHQGGALRWVSKH